MNLLEFQNKISSNLEQSNSLFSEAITLCNILNGSFRDDEIVSINIDKVSKSFCVVTCNEEAAKKAEMMNGKIVPGAFKPFYQLNISRESCSLKIILTQYF